MRMGDARGPGWGRWVLANVAGGLLGTVLGVPLAFVTLGAGFGLAVGAVVGLAQWLMLRRTALRDSAREWRPSAFGWVGASAGAGLLPGWLLVFAVVLGASNGGIRPTDAAEYIAAVAGSGALFAGLPGAGLGLVPGGVQWLVLRLIWPGLPTRYGLGWLAATVVGWGTGWALAGAGLGLVITAGSARGAATALLLAVGVLTVAGGWAAAGALTGAVLAWLNAWAATAPVVPPAPTSPPEEAVGTT